jgi:hypothetical protein
MGARGRSLKNKISYSGGRKKSPFGIRGEITGEEKNKTKKNHG